MWTYVYFTYEKHGTEDLNLGSEDKENQYEISILSISQMKIWTPLFLQRECLHFSNIYQNKEFV